MGFGPPLVLAGLGGRIANKLIGGKKQKQEVYQILSQAFMDKDFCGAKLIKPVNDEVIGQIESNIKSFVK
jgi:hypothetical protein